MTPIPFRPFARFALSSCLLASLALAPTPSRAGTLPVIDGNLDDLLAFAGAMGSGCGGQGADASGEIQTFDPKIIPCPPIVAGYYENGFDLVLGVVAYDAPTQTLFVGLRAAGAVGDTDGNGIANTSGGGSCNPLDNVADAAGIGQAESYAWRFDLDGDTFTDAVLTVTDNAITTTNLPGITTGDAAFVGSDLEVAVSPVVLPASFAVTITAESIFDGLNEDRIQNVIVCAAPTPAVPGTWGALKHSYR